MLDLLFTAALVALVVCTICGVVGFFCDIRRFKSEIEFSGNRKQLIHYLMFGDENDSSDVCEVIENEN